MRISVRHKDGFASQWVQFINNALVFFLNFALLYSLLSTFWLFALLLFRQLAFPPKRCVFYRQHAHNHRKPNWIRHEILRLKAHMPQAGCRCVARTFNRLHPDASVGKTFVADLIAHRWSMLGHLCLAIAQHGKPRKLRTDNEAILNSWVFNAFLKLAGIQHQTTQKHAPWQNGRIERLFGTLKPLLKQLAMPNGAALQTLCRTQTHRPSANADQASYRSASPCWTDARLLDQEVAPVRARTLQTKSHGLSAPDRADACAKA